MEWIKNADKELRRLKPGEWVWAGEWPKGHASYGDPAAIAFGCLCGKEHRHNIHITVLKAGRPPLRNREQIWGWNGDLEKPTLQPRLKHHDGTCEWQGLLLAGQFEGVET